MFRKVLRKEPSKNHLNIRRIEEANQLADKAIMRHLTITIGVMVGIALVIGFVANTIA